MRNALAEALFCISNIIGIVIEQQGHLITLRLVITNFSITISSSRNLASEEITGLGS
jgi:hypothetical protein